MVREEDDEKEKSQQINLQTHRDNMLIYMLLNDVASPQESFSPLIRLDSPNYLNLTNSKRDSPPRASQFDRF